MDSLSLRLPTSEPRRESFASLLEEYGRALGLLMVLDGASAGLADEQIAQTLGLRTSTVNSFWVRIRGKIGSFSRTELVATFLRHQARELNERPRSENRRFVTALEVATEQFTELCQIQVDRQNALPLMVLTHLPEATFVTKPPADIVFANRRARRLYRASVGSLEGLPMRDLTTAATPEALREPCRDLFAPGGPAREVVGIESPYYARRCDGSNLRAVVHAERFELSDSLFAVVTVREYLGDVDDIVQALRRSLEPV